VGDQSGYYDYKPNSNRTSYEYLNLILTSGSPMFTSSGNNAEIFGMIVQKRSSHAEYEPYPLIDRSLGLR